MVARRGPATMRRFLLFAGMQYYPFGGWSDFRGAYDTLIEALSAQRSGDWWQVVDTESMSIVAQG